MPYTAAQQRLIDHLQRLGANLKAGGHAEAARFMFDVGGRSPPSRFARCALPDALKAEVEETIRLKRRAARSNL